MGRSEQSTTVPPDLLFVSADQALLIFPSTAAAQAFLKASDVAEGLYERAYGPNGEPYRLGCAANRVVVERASAEPRPDDLKALLLRHLEACEDPADATQPLDEIVAIAWSIEADYHLRCDPPANRAGASVSIWPWAGLVAALGAMWYFAFR